MKCIIQQRPASECMHCVFTEMGGWAFLDSAPLNPYGDANCLSKDRDFLFAFQFNGLFSSTLHISLESREVSLELDENFCWL